MKKITVPVSVKVKHQVSSVSAKGCISITTPTAIRAEASIKIRQRIAAEAMPVGACGSATLQNA